MMRFLILLVLSAIAGLAIIMALPMTGLARANGEISWTASLYANKTAIADAIKGPRILFVGGSSTLFSFDAEAAEKRLGRPVVNFGTHAGLGLDYILDRAERVMRPGDIVVLAPEYELVTQVSDTSEYAIQLVAFHDRAYLAQLPWRQRLQYLVGYNVLPGLVSSLRGLSGAIPIGREDITLDKYGDVRGNSIEKSKSASLEKSEPSLRPLAEVRMAHLQAFTRTAQRRHIPVYVIPPALIATPGYRAIAFQRFQHGLKRRYNELGAVTVADAADAFLPPQDMYDSVYHANDRGRARYTDHMVTALCKAIACP